MWLVSTVFHHNSQNKILQRALFHQLIKILNDQVRIVCFLPKLFCKIYNLITICSNPLRINTRILLSDVLGTCTSCVGHMMSKRKHVFFKAINLNQHKWLHENSLWYIISNVAIIASSFEWFTGKQTRNEQTLHEYEHKHLFQSLVGTSQVPHSKLKESHFSIPVSPQGQILSSTTANDNTQNVWGNKIKPF